MLGKSRSLYAWLLILIVAASALPACGASAGHAGGNDLSMAPLAQMPMEVQAAPVVVQEAYRFAAANPEILQHLPCYCGCGPIGHTSNYACYFAAGQAGGPALFDAHALGCSICVDITQDAMRLLRQGKGIEDIRAYVDMTYAKYGPSNMP